MSRLELQKPGRKWRGPLDTTHALAALGVAASLLACAAESTEEQAGAVARHDAQTFYSTVSLSGASFSADESRVLYSSDATGIFNAYAMPLGGGEAEALTDSTTEAIRTVSWFPADDRFLYAADSGGNELDHLFVRELDGSVTDLTPGEGLRASFMGWSDDKRHFFVQTNERDNRYFDIYRYSTDSYERELLYQNEQYLPSRVSRDGRWIAMVLATSNLDSDVYLHDTTTGETVLVTEHEGDVSHGVATFTPDSKELYYTTNGHGEFRQVWSYDLASGETSEVLAADWDVLYVSFSETGRYRISAVNADASTEVEILDTEDGGALELPPLPPGTLSSVVFSPSEQRVALYVASDRSPRNLVLVDLAENEARQLTRTLAPAIAEEDLVESEVVRYASFDGLDIPAILYRPHGSSAEAPVPAMLWVHGGPGGQSRKGYNPTLQHLVNHGYAVLAVNNRGSSGYGKTFHHMDDRKHGEVDLADCVAARGYLEGLDWVDGSRIGIMGGSYGGYMVAAALAFEPEVFDVGIDIFGVTNWLRTLSNMPPWWTANRNNLYAEMGDPAVDEERLRRISPLFHAENIVRPILVVQGANDPRVLQVESDELVAAARANGVPVEYVIFPDEGHGFRSRANRITASEKYLEFLDTHLGGT